MDSAPNLGPLISRWEINEFENCWYTSVSILKVLKLLFQQFLNLSSSQRDMSGPISGDLSNNRWFRDAAWSGQGRAACTTASTDGNPPRRRGRHRRGRLSPATRIRCRRDPRPGPRACTTYNARRDGNRHHYHIIQSNSTQCIWRYVRLRYVSLRYFWTELSSS